MEKNMKKISVVENRPKLVDEIEPRPGKNELIVELLACGICGSDLGNIFGKSCKCTDRIGHEISGRVIEIGNQVKNFIPGEIVIINHHCPCLKCHYCIHGNETMCEKFIENIFPCGLSEKILISKWIIDNGGVIKISNNLKFDELTLVEPLACCLRAWDKIPIKNLDKVLIMGCGTIGIFHATIAKIKGAVVTGCDFDEFRLNFGLKQKKFDNIISLSSKNSIPTEVFDLCIIANSDVDCLNHAINSIRKGGTILFFGEPQENAKVMINFSTVYSKEIKILTSYSATVKDFKKSLIFLEKNYKEFSDIITHRIPLQNATEGIDIAKSGNSRIKVVITNF